RPRSERLLKNILAGYTDDNRPFKPPLAKGSFRSQSSGRFIKLCGKSHMNSNGRSKKKNHEATKKDSINARKVS
ncbi:MAG TPA: hypothetical protein VFN98_05770, partial [Nitrososphaeraceae archaeon]|nr:hypothetical protein [Nitrososphaeraceae archaeon]